MSFDADSLRAEKEKVLVRGAAARRTWPPAPRAASTRAGWQGGDPGRAATWRRRASPPDSPTETYAAIKLEVDNRRWAGVPFYLRTGKRLAAG